MKLTSALKKLVNFYPITLIFILLLLSSITAIFIQSHVYAMSQKDNTPGCNCVDISPCPTQLPSDFELCVLDTECYCKYKGRFRVTCPSGMISQQCYGQKSNGCGGTIPCENSDCPGCNTCACICPGCTVWTIGTDLCARYICNKCIEASTPVQ